MGKKATAKSYSSKLSSSNINGNGNSATVIRENAAHFAFAQSRSSDFVYAESDDYMRIIDNHCKVDSSVGPLVLIGAPGCGKSSLVANWAIRRSKATIGLGQNELIFQHYVGCSYDSVKLSLFLYRFMHQLKVSFSLRDFELPSEHEEEPLKFSFARCLEAAVNSGPSQSSNKVKRRNIILILDGIDNLRTEDGGESLSWLPNRVPPGITIILCASQPQKTNTLPSCRWISRKEFAYDSDDEIQFDSTFPASSVDTHTIRELRRRKASFLVVEQLDERTALNIIKCYNEKHKRDVLSDKECNQLLDARGSSCPMYLRIVLETITSLSVNEKTEALNEFFKAYDFCSLYEVVIKQWNKSVIQDIEDVQLNSEMHLCSDTSLSSCSKLCAQPETNTDVCTEDLLRDAKNRKSSRVSKGDVKLQPLIVDAHDMEKVNIIKEERSLLARHLLSFLAVSRYGLSEKEIHQLLVDSAPYHIRVQLISLIRPHIMRIKRPDCDCVMLNISHGQLRLIVRYGFLYDENLRLNYHKALAKSFQSTSLANQRRIDELPVHFEYCNLWPDLQATLVNINMFKLWWTSRNKEDFIAYWMIFRNHCTNYDPVEEYVRSLDEYIDSDSPKGEELLTLTIMIAEFLRCWQKYDKEQEKPELKRPESPKLDELLSVCSAAFSQNSQNFLESKDIRSVMDVLCPLAGDSYFVNRWLWTQFPLIALGIENRFLQPFFSQENYYAESSKCTQKGIDSKVSENIVSHIKLPSSISKKPIIRSSTGLDCPVIKMSPSKGKLCSQPVLENATDESSLHSFEFLFAENDTSSISFSSLKEEVREIRVKYDKLKFLVKEKTALLTGLESKLLDSKAMSSESILNLKKKNDIQDRINWAQNEAQKGKLQGQYYKLILKQCEVHPAKEPHIIEASEDLVRKRRQEIEDLQLKSQLLGYDRKLASIEIPKLANAIDEKEEIHRQALSRLRWHKIQCQRRYQWEADFRLKSRDLKTKVTNGDMGAAKEGEMISKAQEKVKKRKQTSNLRTTSANKLKKYKGSNYKDDGLLGTLRRVGVHQPGDVLLLWNDQRDHAKQLIVEAKRAREQVANCREHLASRRQDLINLQLGGADHVPNKPGSSNRILNVKLLDQKITEETRLMQQKKARIDRLNSLSDKLRLGFFHIAQLAGVKTHKGMGNTEVVDLLEQGIRQLVGDESHHKNNPSSSSSNGDKTNSSNNLGSPTPAKLRSKSSFISNGSVPVLRSSEEKMKFNIRVNPSVSVMQSKKIADVSAMKKRESDFFGDELIDNILNESDEGDDDIHEHQHDLSDFEDETEENENGALDVNLVQRREIKAACRKELEKKELLSRRTKRDGMKEKK